MFLGHFGIGLAVKRISPGISLLVLLPVSLTPDLLALPAIVFPHQVPDLVPWTHGLFMCFVIALSSAIIVAFINRHVRYAAVIGCLVFSHWLLDFISWPMFGRGLPVFFNGSPEIGLGLYSTSFGSIAGEIGGAFLIVTMVIVLKNAHRKSA